MKKILALILFLTLLCFALSSCDMSYMDGNGLGDTVDNGSTDNSGNATADNALSDENMTAAPVTEAPTEPDTEPPVTGPVLSHTYYLSGPYDVKGGYVSGTVSPTVGLSLSDIFDLDMLAEQDFLCRITVNYNAAVQGDHLNLRFSMTVGGSFVLVDDYRYLDNDQTASQNHGV